MTFSNIFSSVVDSKNSQISSIKDEIGQLEQFIREINEKIAGYRQDVTTLELERHQALEAEQSAESALLQVSQAIELIRGFVPEAETIFRENLDSIFNTQPIALLNASIEDVETVEPIIDEIITIVDETETPENETETTTIDEVDVEVIPTETDVIETVTEATETANDLLPEETRREIEKSKDEMDLEILEKALHSEDYQLVKKAAKIVKERFGNDGKSHPSLKSPASELRSYIRKYLPEFKQA